MARTLHHHAYSMHHIKIKESSSSASHNFVISAAASLKIREHFWFSHNKSENKTQIHDYAHGKINLSSVG